MKRTVNESLQIAVCLFGRVLTIVIALAALIAGEVSEVKAQDDRRFEIGAQFTFLKLRSVTTPVTVPCLNGPTPCVVFTFSDNQDLSGFGGRFGYKLTRHFGLESEVNYFPANNLTTGRNLEALFGAKAGKQFGRIGLFLKGRPGFVHSTRGTLTANGLCPLVTGLPESFTCASVSGVTNFAIDVGGIVEVKTSKRTFVRFDAGDLILRRSEHLQIGTLSSNGLSSPVVVSVPATTRHEFQTSVGFGFRF
jgi:hypothetical protein